MLLQNIEEAVPHVFTQLGVLIARIARMDCPNKWPELLPLLSEVGWSHCEHNIPNQNIHSTISSLIFQH